MEGLKEHSFVWSGFYSPKLGFSRFFISDKTPGVFNTASPWRTDFGSTGLEFREWTFSQSWLDFLFVWLLTVSLRQAKYSHSFLIHSFAFYSFSYVWSATLPKYYCLSWWFQGRDSQNVLIVCLYFYYVICIIYYCLHITYNDIWRIWCYP